MTRRWRVPWSWVVTLALLLLPTVLMFFLVQNPQFDAEMMVPHNHFYIVSIISLIAFFIATLTTVAARQIDDARVTLFSLAFLGISGVFLVHGLSTPGVLLPESPGDGYSYGPGSTGGYGSIVTLSARLSLLLGAFLFFASALGQEARWNRWICSHSTWVYSGFTGGIVVYGAIALLDPEVLEAAPIDSLWVTWPTMALTAAMYLYAAYKYHRSYVLSRLPLHLSAVIGLLFLAQAQLAMHLAPVWRLSWWEYHALMLVGFSTIVGGVVTEYVRGKTLRGMVDALFTTETLAKVEQGYGEGIRALAAAIEVKDPYTRGHLQRVADLALAIGEEMGLPPERLRTLAIGANLHDIGKLGVSDAILRKPGRLSPEEFDELRKHPRYSDVILRTLPSLKDVVALVRHHHEWWNGSGYPDGLKGEGIPLGARIIAVADMYDALNSARAYRPAWSRERAMATLQQEMGTHLDPACVAAFERALARRPAEAAPNPVPFAPGGGKPAPGARETPSPSTQDRSATT